MVPTPPRGQALMLLATGALALLSVWGSPYPAIAPLQTIPTLAMLAGMWLGLPRWPLSSAAAACACAFLVLHTIGGRYVYSYVPYDQWFAAIGLPTLSETFGFQRNHYDRLVHFSFGLLLFVPIREWLSRYTRLGFRWSVYVALEFVLAISAAYEIFEWWLTLVMAPGNADAYNGQQGDMWDAQKDMALAFCGALVTAALTAIRKRGA